MIAKKDGVNGQNGVHVFQDVSELNRGSVSTKIRNCAKVPTSMEWKQKKNHVQIANVRLLLYLAKFTKSLS